MNERQAFFAFLAILGSIVLLFSIASLLLYFGRSVEAVGIGGVMTGLIGVLGSFTPQRRKVEVDNPTSNPVPVEPQP